MGDLVGKTLGDFQIEALLGKGSMAQVFQARQISLRRQVALKVLEEGLFTPHDNIKRFIREAEAMARLEHPHIVPVYAAGEATPFYFFAMRLVRGGSLADAMRTGIQRRIAIRWAYEVCQALAFAHAAGIVHRDLKPSNVLIHDGVAVLADFGLARLRDLSTITQRGYLLGTPLYMSPEQTLGEELRPATDCFSLGVILYETLLGRHPFSPENKRASKIEARAELFERIQKAQFTPASHVDPTVPAVVEKVIAKALAREPASRYADGGAMLRDLEEAFKGLSSADSIVQNSNLETDPSPEARAQSLEETEDLSTPSPIAASKQTPGARRGFGRYEIREEIGHGGQGIVYKAYDPVLDREVALKVLQNRRTEDKQMEKLFAHEARTAARLTHPNIVQVYDFGAEESALYITMQLVSGKSLDMFLADRQPLPPYFVVHVLLQASEGLAFAHEAGVVHLDVKPSNLMIGRSTRTLPDSTLARFGNYGDPHVYILDFTMAAVRKAVASARISAPGDRRQRIAGTISYASPEQISGVERPAEPANDIFSLGIVVHEMLTGARLFPGDSVALAQIRMTEGKIPPPSSRAPGIPAELDSLCARMLAPKPENRPESMRGVARVALDILKSLEQAP